MPLTGLDLLRAARALQVPAPGPLAPLLGRRIDRLSGGQYQLLCVWCALAAPADLVVLDEPTNNLDPETESVLAGLLGSHASGPEGGRRAVLVVSHEATFLRAACSRVIPLEDTRSLADPACAGEPVHA
jgi:zinc transport system ATP-binding protein